MRRANGSIQRDEDTTKGKDHEELEGPMTRGILKKAQHSDEDTTKGKDHEALEGPMTRGKLKQAQHVIEIRLVICIAAIDDD